MRLPFIGERPWPPIWSMIEWTFPFVTVLIALLLTASFSTNGQSFGFVPMLGILVVYYWRLYLPILLPAWVLLILSLVQDVLLGDPLGLAFLTYLPSILMSQSKAARRFGSNFWFAWFLFAPVLVATALIHYGLIMGLNLRFLDPTPVVMRYGASWLFFPAFAILFAWFESRLASSLLGVERGENQAQPKKKLRKSGGLGLEQQLRPRRQG